MRILCFSTLFPNQAQPSFGVFVENRLQKLLRTYGPNTIDIKVVAPVPWFPSKSKHFGQYATFAQIPLFEQRFNVDIHHPRYLVLPKIGMYLTPYAMFRSGLKTAQRLIADGFDFDLIDAHYFYPDGVAASWIAKALGKPYFITARGTDINLIPAYPKARQLILEAGENATGMIAVCQALKDEMVSIGLEAHKITVLRNGVDLEKFSPQPRKESREAWNIDRPTLLSVGGLIERKGHDITIKALSYLPDHQLLLAGEGPERRVLERLARSENVTDRVRFLGPVAHHKLSQLYSAADISVLSSSREGWANVLLESMACGCPVVASNVWGTPECITAPQAGELMQSRTAESLANAVKTVIARAPDRRLTRLYAEHYSWDSTSHGQFQLFEKAIATEAPKLTGKAA